MSDVVPFGKYKGQAVEVLAQDHQYVEWLTAQPWFKERYQTIYNVVVNYQEPTETPEHNSLQVLFLDSGFCSRFVSFLSEKNAFNGNARFESGGFDVIVCGSVTRDHVNSETKEIKKYDDRVEYHVEIKPTVGDDYPAVLRQIKKSVVFAGTRAAGDAFTHWCKPVLFLEKYIGVGATEQQFIEIFERDNIKVVFRDEV